MLNKPAPETGRAIACGIFDVPNQRMASVGYRLYPAYRRQGKHEKFEFVELRKPQQNLC